MAKQLQGGSAPSWVHEDEDRDWGEKPEELESSLGDRIKKSLQYSGVSVGELAQYLEAHRNSVSGWIANRAKPMPIVLRVIAEKCEVPYEWLLTGKWPEPPKAARPAPAKRTPARSTGKSNAAAKPKR